MSDVKKSLPQAVQDCHKLIVWLIPQLDKFPRNRRFTLGERIETAILGVLETLVEAAYSRNRRPLLKQANVQLAVARHLWRAAHGVAYRESD
jgi:predicted lipoprotein